MNPTSPLAILKTIESANVIKFSHCYVSIKTDGGEITIEKRPLYCDRGKYIIKVFSSCPVKLHIDESDMFPRYYFAYTNMIDEIERWINARNLTVESINIILLDNIEV